MLIQSATVAIVLLAAPWVNAKSEPVNPLNPGQILQHAVTCVDATQGTADGKPSNPMCADEDCAHPGIVIRKEGDGIAIAKVCDPESDSQDSQPAVPLQSDPDRVTGFGGGPDQLPSERVFFGYDRWAWSCISINGKPCPPHLHGAKSLIRLA